VTPEWIPIFTRVLKDEEILKEAYVFSTFADGIVHCKVCDARIPAGQTPTKHLAGHRRELKEYRKRRDVERERERREADEVRRREREMEREVLGDRASVLPEEKRLKNRVTSVRYKVNHPEKHGREEWKPDELKRLNAQLAEAVAAVESYKAREAA